MAAGAVQVILLDPALGPNTMFIGRPTVASGARPTGASSLTSFRNVKLAAAMAKIVAKTSSSIGMDDMRFQRPCNFGCKFIAKA
jgi:hypothetical protein